MKFICKTVKLKKAISKIERIVSKQVTLPILGNILISAKKGQLVLSSTNLELAVKVLVGVKIEKEGNLTIPARMLSGFLGSVNSEVVSCEAQGEKMKVETGKHKIEIKGIKADDYPIIPKKPKDILFELEAGEFIKRVAPVLISVAHNDTRQELNGVFFGFDEGGLRIASTDSFRLIETIIPLNKKDDLENYNVYREKNKSVIVPAITIVELLRDVEEDDEIVSFSIDQGQLFVSTKSTRVISRLVVGDYPEYQQIIPVKFEIEVRVDKREFIDAVKIASLVSEDQNGEVVVKSDKSKGELKLTAQSVDTGGNESIVSAKIKGFDFEMMFNCRYLLEGLNSALFNTKDILLKLNKQKSPVVIKNTKKDSGFSYVVMPIIK